MKKSTKSSAAAKAAQAPAAPVTTVDVAVKYADLIAFVAKQSVTPPAFCATAPDAIVAEIVAANPNLIEIVPGAVKDAAGNIAIRSKSVASQATETAQSTTEGDVVFTLEENIPLPEVKRGGLKGETYPFDSMKVGQSFFVAGTADKPNPAKSLASTVSSASKRYAEKDGRQFTVRSVIEYRDASGKVVAQGTPGAVEVKGARVWRVADKPKTPAQATAATV